MASVIPASHNSWDRWFFLRVLRLVGGVRRLGRQRRDALLDNLEMAQVSGAICERSRTLKLLQRCKALELSLDDLRREIIAESVDDVVKNHGRQQFNAEGGFHDG